MGCVKRHGPVGLGLCLVMVAVVTTGCGTRVRNGQAGSATLGPASSGEVPEGQALPGTGSATNTGGIGSSPSSPNPEESPGGSVVPGPNLGDSRTTAPANSSSGSSSGGSSTRAASPTHGGTPKGGPPPGPATPGPGAGPATSGTAGTASPVKIASVGSWSGPAGNILIGNLQGLQVWVRWINDRGGVNGHPVELTVADDGADPARHRALVQEMVERKKVVAFVQNSNTVAGKPSQEYITASGVPVIGGDTGGQFFYESPMYFPQATSGDNLLKAVLFSMARRTVPKGQTKLGTLTCQEVGVCHDADRIWNSDLARTSGLEPVYRGKASLAQPDFTAECLAASSRGVELFLITLAPATIPRFAESCARQNYRPVIGIASSMANSDQAKNPTLDGMLLTVYTFPWIQSTTPATAEFQAAMKHYAPQLGAGAGHSVGWVSAKLFEKAAARTPEPPTSAAVLEGLWSIKDDTLGGLTYPLTFTRGQTAPQVVCWFDLSIGQKQWIIDNNQLQCQQ